MPQAPLAEDIRHQVQWDFEQGRSNKFIAEKRGVKARTVVNYRKAWEEQGAVYTPSSNKGGRPRCLPDYVIYSFNEYMALSPDAYLLEISWHIWDQFGIEVSDQTVARALLHDLKMTRKKLQRVAAQRDPVLRARFYTRMAQYEPHELVFMDESAASERTGK